MTKLDEIVAGAGQAIGVRRIYGEPYEKNGITIIPAARVMGGAGSGTSEPSAAGDEATTRTPAGSGAGFGLSGGPVGAFVIKGDQVKWLPAVDVNRMLLGINVVLIVFFLVVRSIAKTRAKALVEAARAAR